MDNKEIYDDKDYKKDKENFYAGLNNGKVRWGNFQRLVLSDLIVHDNILETKEIMHIPLERVQHALRSPHMLHHWRLLLQVSQHLMKISTVYYRLNMYFGQMSAMNWGLDIWSTNGSNTATVKKKYIQAIDKLESMNLKHEFGKILMTIPFQDVYYGLVIENQSNFFIQQVDPYICKLYQVEDGLYNFIIDLGMIPATDLGAYPSELQQAWLEYHDGLREHWYYPPNDKQICIKGNSFFTFPYPMLLGVLRDILDVDTFKDLRLQANRLDNYKAICIKVPIDESQIDKPLITPELLSMFSTMDREALNPDIGLVHTLGSDAKAIDFENSSNASDDVDEAINNVYDSAGTNHLIFNGASSATAVKMSIENDSAFVYQWHRQLERWTNRFLKYRSFNQAKFRLHFYILDQTVFNRDEVISRYKDSASMGIATDKYIAAIGMTPAEQMGSFTVNNDIFDFYNNLKPLRTSYNSVDVDDTGGRPKSDVVGDEGEATRDKDSNEDR